MAAAAGGLFGNEGTVQTETTEGVLKERMAQGGIERGRDRVGVLQKREQNDKTAVIVVKWLSFRDKPPTCPGQRMSKRHHDG